MVLWEKIGPGPHPCHHCGTPVDWPNGAGPIRGTLISDHLDRNSHNNDPNNLVPACTSCSIINRGYTVTDHEQHHVRKNGTRLREVARTCEWCGANFHVVTTPTRPNKGKFCAKRCQLRWLNAKA